MRAVALLGLNSTEKNVAPFRLPGMDVAIAHDIAPADAALVFGGDGTVHRYLPILHEAQVPVLVVPTGSGNDFAHALGIRSVADALAAWKKFVAGQGNVRSIDLGCIERWQMADGKRQGEKADPSAASQPRDDKAEGSAPARDAKPEENRSERHLFCCVGGVGLDADANRRANAMPRWMRRRGGYLLAMVRAIFGKQRIRIRAQAATPAGEPVLDADEPAELMVFANAPAYGDGILIAPGAKLDDGKLDLVYARRMSRLRLLRVAPTVLRGTHIGLPEVWFARAAEVTVESDPPRMIYADGEPICETPVKVKVLPKGLRVVVP
jgi:diacylglycerol kinase (ATP)